jgi:hypothetical protein
MTYYNFNLKTEARRIAEGRKTNVPKKHVVDLLAREFLKMVRKGK